MVRMAPCHAEPYLKKGGTMNALAINHPISKTVSGLTCRIRLSGVRRSLFRLTIGKWIVRLGVSVAGMNGKVEIE